MRVIIEVFRWLTGALFIFSGMIKINDPVGTSIKLTEYFEVFSKDIHSAFHYFTPYALSLAIVLCVLEVVLGLALLINYKMKITLGALLSLIVFFTFLTFYSAYFNKVTDCGCFGDAIKLSPWESFYKDIVLLVMITFMFLFRSRFQIAKNEKTGLLVIILAAVLNFSLAYYAVEHLPFIDFRAYKIGVHIPTAMKPTAAYKYNYVMLKDGKKEIFDQYPTDESYEFFEMILMNPEVQPKITDFNVWSDEGDFTQYVLEGEKVLIIITDLTKARMKGFNEIVSLSNDLERLGIQPMVITSSESSKFEVFRHMVQLAVPYYYGDATVLKTIIRANPGIVVLKDGKVLAKYHSNDIPRLDEVLKLYGR
jgi:uncharacterized membrane protein YphA (DoxX/SURF4 family)